MAAMKDIKVRLKLDVTPPGRESQVQALKEKPGIDNPWAVAWASYNRDEDGEEYSSGDAYDAAKCDACGETVPVREKMFDVHLARKGGPDGESAIGKIGHKTDASMAPEICPGSGASTSMDAVKASGGKWVVMEKDSGNVVGAHATRQAATEQVDGLMRAPKSDGKRFLRVDRGEVLKAPEVTPEGYLRLDGKIARTGVQLYRRADGSEYREYRPSAEVFDQRYLDSFSAIPLTDNHPPRLLDPATATEHAVGAVSQARKLDAKWVGGSFSIWDRAAIAAVRSGRAQLSVGYSCEVDDTPGVTPDGERYDGVQRNIVANHLALVDAARAGSEARARLDADGNADGFVSPENGVLGSGERHPPERTNTMAHVLKVDGMQFSVDDGNAQSAVDRAIAAAEAKGEARASAEKQRADNAEVRRQQSEKERDEAKAKYDSLKAEVDEKIKMDGAEISVTDLRDQAKRDAFLQGAVHRAASARAALLVEARRHLGANEKFDEHAGKDGKVVPAKSDIEIKRLVVLKLDKDAKLEGRSEDYVQARYDAEIERFGRQSRTAEPARHAQAPAAVEESAREDQVAPPSDPSSARRAMIERYIANNRPQASR